MHSRPSLLAVAAASVLGALVAFTPGSAQAKVLSNCGNIDLDSGATCTFETSGGCTADCTPLKFQLSCSAQLEASCSGSCNATVDVNCSTSCEASCTGSCTPGSVDCEGYCDTDCSGH